MLVLVDTLDLKDILAKDTDKLQLLSICDAKAAQTVDASAIYEPCIVPFKSYQRVIEVVGRNEQFLDSIVFMQMWAECQQYHKRPFTIDEILNDVWFPTEFR
ncbi:hypothetical protein DPMN_054281 [Dreissena polymorpha]|uniref:Uncharacterized protein n=1 Tax=Dreissena polymorpha TaxID=45954 RepID=A0A9D4CNL9_DREPO|nr:hypothetical protein DPMN_054281 [Dreissena polymorpha]